MAPRDAAAEAAPDLGAIDQALTDVAPPTDTGSADVVTDGGSCTSDEGAGVDVPAGLSAHFVGWIKAQGHDPDLYDRADLAGGSFGGLASDTDCARRQPVVFVHGNADRAIGGPYGGWTASLEHFVGQGYRRAELYGTTYGPADALQMWDYTHGRETIMRVRRFIEAVLAYTGADKVDVIAHSMGVTVARRAIKGGPATDLEGDYQVGHPLTDRVDTFVGIAGGNRGLSACYLTPTVPACNATDGFYPGQLLFGAVVGQSDFISALNETSGFEGSHRYAIWSEADEVITGACLVWGENTCRIADQTDEKVYYVQPYSHYGIRDLTGEVQHGMVADHTVP